MDRMRESLFSILSSAYGSLEGLTVLDLFSGSGSMALEALSRGARSAVLVERDRGKAAVIRANLGYVEAARWRLITVPAERYVKRAAGSRGPAPEPPGRAGNADPPPFDLVFADPPFRYPGKTRVLASIAEAGLLAPGGRLVLHFPKEDEIDEPIVGLELVDRRAYGRSIVQMYEPL
jgi:16S rRNA (guanine(966)-N(2))-methyltransferase RsmD